MKQKGPVKETESVPYIRTQKCISTQKKISILLSATTVLQAFLMVALPAPALLSSLFVFISTLRAVCEAVQ